MFVDELIKQPGLWAFDGDGAGIVISSRIRLARNLSGHPFPGWASDEARERVAQNIRRVLSATAALKRVLYLDMGELAQVDRDILKERHLISQDMALLGHHSGVALLRDEHVAIMVNEEDHLRMQVISPGLTLTELWQRIDRIDTEIEQRVEYAFSPRVGYLTACPSNVGTGLRASVMMHLSGLRLLNEIDPVIKGLEKMGLTVRGLLGEGSDAQGNIFQISNQATLGDTEARIVEGLMTVADELSRHEIHARARLLEDRRMHVIDHVSRALGILTSAHLLTSSEAMDLLAAVRLGVELGMVRNLTAGDLNDIMLLTQPGHLQKIHKRELHPDVRDEVRAQRVRHRIMNARMVN